MKHISLTSLLLVLAFVWSLATRPAYAYLDPSAGSYFLQIALGGVFAGLFALKTFWSQIRDFISQKLPKKPS